MTTSNRPPRFSHAANLAPLSPDLGQSFAYHRSSTSSPASSAPASAQSSPRTPSLDFPSNYPTRLSLPQLHVDPPSPPSPAEDSPRVCGLPLKYLSLITLAVQNAALSIVMHYSRVSTPPSQSYTPADAVLLNEILKGSISFFVALYRVAQSGAPRPLSQLFNEIFSPDCWKLSIPALLYVVQNSLQFVAISNLPVATFQVTYQMKILTTAAFSVALLRKRINPVKWAALFLLALGVAIVQIQTSTSSGPPKDIPNVVGSAHEYRHTMRPLRGFGAVTAACFTSGLAGVYFEMVLKNSKADLWVRNVQLSFFSLLPALLPILLSPSDTAPMFANFGPWAWGTVAVQTLGGLITALVIKYSDNILKGFATSLSIVLSFLASVALFDFHITPSFSIGAATVLAATWLYNQPAGSEPRVLVSVVSSATGSKPSPRWEAEIVSPSAPILGELSRKDKDALRRVGSATSLASSDGYQMSRVPSSGGIARVPSNGGFGSMRGTERYLSAPYGSPMPSRTPSPQNSRPPSRAEFDYGPR